MGKHRSLQKEKLSGVDKSDFMKIVREKHKLEHPGCEYGDKAHYVPPSFGQVGFYLCDPPKDVEKQIGLATRIHNQFGKR